MSDKIWIQAVWQHSSVIPERSFLGKNVENYLHATKKKDHEKLPSMQRVTCKHRTRLAPFSKVIFSKTDNLSEIAIYKLYLEVVLG